MSEITVTQVFFERAQMVLIGQGDLKKPPVIYNADGDSVKASYFLSNDNQFRIEYDVISGNNQYPLTNGRWFIDINSCFDKVEKNYSAHRVLYKLDISSGDKISIDVAYNPANITGIRLIVFPILKFSFFVSTSLLRFLFNIARYFHSGKNIVLFTSESHDSPSDNMQYVINKAIDCKVEKRYIFKYAFLNKKCHSAIKYAWFLLRTAFKLGTANVVVIDDYHPLIYQMKFKKNVKVVQVWHACGAYKTVGYARCGKRGAPTISNNSHRNYTHAIVSGEGVRRCYSEAFGIPIENVYACGVPRTDEFYSNNYKQRAKDEIDEQFPQFKGKNKILFAPTFRGHGKESANYPMDKIDFDAFEDYCRKTNTAVFFKMHPFVMEKVPIKEEQQDVFVDAGAYREINKLIAASDLLITDYSSSIYEAALLSTPIMFYVFDLEQYIASRSFFKPFDQYLAGKVVYDFDQLITALENKDFEKEKMQMLIDNALEKCDGNASKRVVDLIFDK